MNTHGALLATATWSRRLLAAMLVAIVAVGAFAGLWLVGAVSRVKVRALSPDGAVEAVCRGRLPEATEYDVWLRRNWQPWGTYLAHSGTESMGRCREIVWSPDGSLVVVVNEGNALVVLDVEAGRELPLHGRRLAPGESWDYSSARIITSLRFTSGDAMEFEHCNRGETIPDDGRNFSRCGTDRRRDRARLVRTSSGVSLTAIADGTDAR